MKRRASPLLAFLLLPAALLVLSGCFAGDAQLQEPTAVIDPGVLEALQHQAEVNVDIALKEPAIPFEQQTTAYRRQYAGELQARVLSALTASDFTLTHQFEISAALSGRLTKSGLEKLATHPNVVSVALSCCGSGGGKARRPVDNGRGVVC